MFDFENGFIFNAGCLNRLLMQRLDALLEGLTFCQFIILFLLKKNGSLYGTQLSILYKGDRTTISRGIDVLKRLGYVESRPRADRRERYYGLTDLGEKMLTKNLEWVESEEKKFSPGEVALLRNAVINMGRYKVDKAR